MMVIYMYGWVRNTDIEMAALCRATQKHSSFVGWPSERSERLRTTIIEMAGLCRATQKHSSSLGWFSEPLLSRWQHCAERLRSIHRPLDGPQNRYYRDDSTVQSDLEAFIGPWMVCRSTTLDYRAIFRAHFLSDGLDGTGRATSPCITWVIPWDCDWIVRPYLETVKPRMIEVITILHLWYCTTFRRSLNADLTFHAIRSYLYRTYGSVVAHLSHDWFILWTFCIFA
jgi:hypothetical protein